MRRPAGRSLRVPGSSLRLVLALLVLVSCAGQRAAPWGQGARFEGFDPETLNPGGAADFSVLLPLSQVFYERIANRRFNSKATHDDPALREFFRTSEAFADFYASLAEALETAHFESQRPTRIRLLRMQRVSRNAVDVRVRYRGENGLPLRWWSTSIVREDRWEFGDGRWYVIPGKV